MLGDLIAREECPLMDAIYMHDGAAYVIKLEYGSEPRIRVVCETSIDSYFKFNSLEMVTSIEIFKEFVGDEYKVEVGEGGFGSDGIVILSGLAKGDIIWMLFLSNSNPFENAIFNRDYLEVKSTNGMRLSININSPEIINVIL